MERSELATLVARAVADAAPAPSADPGLELALALLRVLAKLHGPAFVDDVRAEIEGKADRMEASTDADDRANAGEIRFLLDG